jgi:predicted small secreted protein
MFRTILMPLAAILALAGCETVGGFGQDVENTGEFISEESNEVQSGM